MVTYLPVVGWPVMWPALSLKIGWDKDRSGRFVFVWRGGLCAVADRQATFEAGAGLKAENTLQIQFPDEGVHRRLSVFPGDFRQDQFGGVGVVEPAKPRLDLQQFARPVDSHPTPPWGRILAPAGVGRKEKD